MLLFLLIVLITLVGVFVKPWKSPEYLWALFGALACLACGFISPLHALDALWASSDVIAFLIGMMLLSEMALLCGLFEWLANRAVGLSQGSNIALYGIVYTLGILTTAFLSNDATAVVLTPSVAMIARKAKVDPIPLVLACAFVANAASTLLPIANPANLVLYATHLPTFNAWIQMFWLPSLASIVVTGLLLFLTQRHRLQGRCRIPTERVQLTRDMQIVIGGIFSIAIALFIASVLHVSLGLVTLIFAVPLLVLVFGRNRENMRVCWKGVAWGILVFVAALFVMTAAADQIGLLALVEQMAPQLSGWRADAAFATSITAASALANNLPVGVVTSHFVNDSHHAFFGISSEHARRLAVLVIDIGPNIAVTASLATMLWLQQLKKADIEYSSMAFFRIGLIVLPLSLLAAISVLR